MLENLLKLVTENAQDAVVNNPDVPNEQNDAVIEHATSGIMDGIKQQISAGNLSDVLKLIGGQGGDVASNPVVNGISGNIISSLMSKFGLNQGAAANVVSNLLPTVIQKLVSQTNDPNNPSFDINGIFNQLSGGKTGGIDFSNILSQLTGGGQIDLSKITGLFTGNDGSQNNNGNTSGGIMDTLKNIFG